MTRKENQTKQTNMQIGCKGNSHQNPYARHFPVCGETMWETVKKKKFFLFKTKMQLCIFVGSCMRRSDWLAFR